MSILTVKNLTKAFGGLIANSDISMDVKKGSITAVIGPNGAGKTTFFNMVTGVYQPTSGDIELNGKSIVGLKPHAVSAKGISRTFQNIRLFGSMTVLENVMVGMHNHIKQGLLGAVLDLPSFKKQESFAEQEAYNILDYIGLSQFTNEEARNLSYGAQRRLEIGRALATRPQILLLDEPAAGMNPKETKELTELIFKMRNEFGLTIVLIEHDMKLVMEISEHIIVLDHGEKIAEGIPEEIRTNQKVIEAYLGKSGAETVS
ncbi:ABC transporter ATP-binding protein [Schinkia azotoformans]|uniref:Putative branched-chain amino acid ABC transporter ATP-binding protein n=1 Tax=Schinkia azotoformans LMG 9581 TaxID=1131731 RepID=K6D4Q0_SCHAZ|nr:ABC transporter ATP-binding protein [Schinkia azotoformans]EKN63003.1 putative branched-chain amino acid ABC transporter ATP-binding protein [Schinkia azotoformans LMG 9581]MEC1639293.1 ABC transporter ATP-binding protein [Schinkia azotoformans]MEC1714389.1 ABC transporter ATP-binding protein [Schinkia azotoformans]MEC1719479.1 ABC transporter ATP-binding protein [Schinkia azotoformans]MEC1741196.1 ABC transporter ATP-binding protein [Schinkia azotoformans]